MSVDDKVAQPGDLLLEGVVNGDDSLCLWRRLYQMADMFNITFLGRGERDM